jgi:hypothetical protein
MIPNKRVLSWQALFYLNISTEENLRPIIPVIIRSIKIILVKDNGLCNKKISAMAVPITAIHAQIEYAILVGKVLRAFESKNAPVKPKPM